MCETTQRRPGLAFLGPSTLAAIRQQYVAGTPLPDIMARFDIRRRTMAKIVKEGKWFKARQALKFAQAKDAQAVTEPMT